MNNEVVKLLSERQIEHAEIVGEIMAYTLLGMIILMAVICIPLFLIALRQEEDKKEYIKKLDEHDKAVIMEYKNLTRYLPRKKKKNE